jgi:hypothetical protein
VAGCEYREGAQGRRSADDALAEETRMMSREQIKTEILQAARVAELRRLAENTARDYDAALAASGLPRQHFNLRLQLLGMLPPPPRKGA